MLQILNHGTFHGDPDVVRSGRDMRQNEKPGIVPEVQSNARFLIIDVQSDTPNVALLNGIEKRVLVINRSFRGVDDCNILFHNLKLSRRSRSPFPDC
jgi:hypothetical protein